MNFKTFSADNLQRYVNETGDDDAWNELRTRRTVEQMQDDANEAALPKWANSHEDKIDGQGS